MLMMEPYLALLNYAVVLPFFVMASIVPILIFILLLSYVSYRLKGSEKSSKPGSLTVGFFHPYCDAGGGGERVLWCGIRALMKRHPGANFVVYTGDLQSAPDQILSRAHQRFHIGKLERVEFVYLHRRNLVEASTWPRFTLFGQSLGSILLGWEALGKYRPDVYLDTMGYAFTLPLFKFYGKCKVGCYVHYPTISTDMLDQVRKRRPAYNNKSSISNSRIISIIKLIYYKIFAFLYGLVGKCSDLTMVNSSWTEEHISRLWVSPRAALGDSRAEKDCCDSFSPDITMVHKVYPPCSNVEFLAIGGTSRRDSDLFRIISVGQFRPEKDHALQIRAMFELRKLLPEQSWSKVRLVLAGGCRNEEDERRVKDLRDLCKHLSVEDNVEFKVNISFDQLKSEMEEATIGLHTMWNEHFGIAVVEMLAAGLITIAHRSGGPLMDIIVEDDSVRNGFLAAHESEYATIIAQVMTELSEEARENIRERARDSVTRFAEEEFEKSWVRTTDSLIS